EIDRRHGVEHGKDPRVYSIGAFKEEWERIEKEREDSFFSRQAILLSDLDVDPSDVPEEGGFYRRLTDCESRHFPGLYPDVLLGVVDSDAKAWKYCHEHADRVEFGRNPRYARMVGDRLGIHGRILEGIVDWLVGRQGKTWAREL